MKCAYTLSEVLVTLGIIGVIAALTLPSIIGKTQKFVLKQQFKKSINIISNALRKSQADFEYLPTCSYGLVSTGNTALIDDCSVLKAQLLKNIKVIKRCPNKALENGCIANIKGIDSIARIKDPNLSEEEAKQRFTGLNNLREYEIHNVNEAVVLNDGQIIMFYSNVTPIYLIDINGLKGPNKWGYDIFTFYIYKNKLACHSNYLEEGGILCSDLLLNP